MTQNEVKPAGSISLDEILSDFSNGLMCSQVVFAHGAEKLGLDTDMARRISAAFGWGMMHGERCGAVTGGMMALGLKYGTDRPSASPDELYQKLEELEKRVVERYGTYVCRDVLGGSCDTAAERERMIADNRLKNCPELVKHVCDILDEIL